MSKRKKGRKRERAKANLKEKDQKEIKKWERKAIGGDNSCFNWVLAP